MKTNATLKIAALAAAAALAVPLTASARHHHPDPEDVLAGVFIASVVAPLVVGAAVASSVRVKAAPRVVYCEPPPPPPPQYYGHRPMRPMHHHRRPAPRPYGY